MIRLMLFETYPRKKRKNNHISIIANIITKIIFLYLTLSIKSPKVPIISIIIEEKRTKELLIRKRLSKNNEDKVKKSFPE